MIPNLTPFAWIIIVTGLVGLVLALVGAARSAIIDYVSRRPEDQ